jgi:predicted benzoate:H+ symporter BenE
MGGLISGVLLLPLALTATLVASLLGVLPSGYGVALAGLAILSSFQEALVKAYGGALHFGPTIAFIIAATSFTFARITAAS